jgi:hypothetical protein
MWDRGGVRSIIITTTTTIIIIIIIIIQGLTLLADGVEGRPSLAAHAIRRRPLRYTGNAKSYQISPTLTGHNRSA